MSTTSAINMRGRLYFCEKSIITQSGAWDSSKMIKLDKKKKAFGSSGERTDPAETVDGNLHLRLCDSVNRNRLHFIEREK